MSPTNTNSNFNSIKNHRGVVISALFYNGRVYKRMSENLNKGTRFEKEVLGRILRNIDVPFCDVEDEIVREIMQEGNLYLIKHARLKNGVSKRGDLRDVDKKGKLKHDIKDIGNVIKDLTVWGFDFNGNLHKLFLSLKEGNVIKYMNMGLKKFLKGRDPKGKVPYEVEEECRGVYADGGKSLTEGSTGDQLLKMLGMPKGSVERDLFFRVFNEYKKGECEKHDVALNTTPRLVKMLRACVGYGYIFVHRIDKNHLHIKRMDLETLKEDFGGVEKAVGHFHIGTSKQVEVDLHLKNGRAVTAVFRHTHRGVIPSIFMFDWRKGV